MKKLLLLLTSIVSFSIANAQILGYSVGDTVDDFTVTTIDGEEINLYTITAGGQYVYIDFFFADCGPCQLTAPHFNEFHERYGCNEGDVFCVSINTGQDDDDYVESYETTYGGDYSPCPITSGDGGSGPVDNDFNPAAYPTICLISPDNELLNGDIWPISSYATFAEALEDEGFTPSEMECTVLSVDVIVEEATFAIYPNPARDFITVELKDNAMSINSIEIINFSGQRVYSDENISDTKMRVGIEKFEAGVYLLNILDSNNNRTTYRFTVLH
jgi:thiol-disulfide isomerase/thioredoxin